MLAVVATIINSWPLSVRMSPEGEFQPILPSDVLLGRAGQSVDQADESLQFVMNQNDDAALDRVESKQVAIVKEWRKEWISQAFPDMVSRPK